MDALEGLIPLLDVVIAALLSAWTLAFATASDAERSTYWMSLRAERVRIGALAIACGMFVDVAAVAMTLVGRADAAAAVGFVSYPLWIGGAIALASATWPDRSPAPAAEAVA